MQWFNKALEDKTGNAPLESHMCLVAGFVSFMFGSVDLAHPRWGGR